MIRRGQLDLDTCLVKIVVEAYVQQKTYIKMFGSYMVAVDFKVFFTYKCIKIMYFYF